MIREGQVLKVSVCVITYNHEKYLRQCLQSIVDQETDFDFEVIVADDCSTDGTRGIIEEFVSKYPNRLRKLFQETNTGGTKNYLDVHHAALGEYIAHMDGDDFALPGKLQKQVDFLDSYQNCVMVGHRVQIINDDGTKILGIKPKGTQPQFSDIERLVRKYIFFNHSSKMYRSSARIFDHSQDTAVIDFLLHVEHASLGQIGFLPDILGSYRKTHGGMTAGTGEQLHWRIGLTLAGYDRARQLGVKEDIVDYGKSRYLIGASALCLSRGDVDGYLRYLNESRKNGKYISVFHAMLFRLRKQTRLLQILFSIRSLISNRL